MSQGDKGDCDLLLSRSFAASDGLPQAFPPLMSCSSARTIKMFILGIFLGWSSHVHHLKVTMLQHQHARGE